MVSIMGPVTDNQRDMSKRALIAALIFVLSTALYRTPLPAQNQQNQTRQNLYAPFISRLEATVNGSEIVLTWRDARDLKGEVYEIWRYRDIPATGQLPAAELVATVSEGRQAFADRPPDGRDFWYGVYGVSGGRRWDLVIPHRNTTVLPASILPGSLEEPRAARITSLSAVGVEEEVVITYIADREGREISIYRSTRPITSVEDLDRSALVAVISEERGRLEDNPIAGVGWYYAAVDTALYRSGSPNTLEFGGTTASATEILLSDSPRAISVARPRRSAPLPILRITKSLEDGGPLPGDDRSFPEKRPLDPVTAAYVERMGPKAPPTEWSPMDPEILPIDSAESDQERQRQLADILHGSFIAGDWQTASDELFALLVSNGIDDETRSRIHFYRGQTAYFSGLPREAFLSFLMARETYYTETDRWLGRLYREFYPIE